MVNKVSQKMVARQAVGEEGAVAFVGAFGCVE